MAVTSKTGEPAAGSEAPGKSERDRPTLAEEEADETSAPIGPDPLLGRELGGKYRIDAFVGRGAMARVYRAWHLALERTVAVKVLNMAFTGDERFQNRFRREARAASRLEHEHSVQCIDFGMEPDGVTYLVMEFLDGRDLHQVIYDEFPMAMHRVFEILSQTLSVLTAAHDAGIVHRDLKPENIMLVMRPGPDGELIESVKVADFGIAKIAEPMRDDDGPRLTAQGVVTGTPEYMAPDQAQARDVDGRADLYACGVMLFEMVCGRLPFESDNPVGFVLKHMSDPVPSVSATRPGADPRLDAIVAKAMAKIPGDRYRDARAMLRAIREVASTPAPANTLEKLDSAPRRSTNPPPTPPITTEPVTLPLSRRERSRRSMPIVVVSSLAIAAVVLFTRWYDHPATTSARTQSVRRAVAASSDALQTSLSASSPRVETTEPPAAVADPPARPVEPAHAVDTALVVSPRIQHTAVRASVSRATLAAHAPEQAAPRAAPIAPDRSTPTPPAAIAPPPTAPTTHVAPVLAPQPALPPRVLRAFTADEQRAEATNGITHGTIASRARDAESALARCAFEHSRAQSTAPDVSHARITVDVSDRVVDTVRIRGDLPYLAGCEAAVRGSLAGLLPAAEDADYTITIDVALHAAY